MAKQKPEEVNPPVVEAHDANSAPTCPKCGTKYLSTFHYERDDRCK